MVKKIKLDGMKMKKGFRMKSGFKLKGAIFKGMGRIFRRKPKIDI